MNRTKTSTKPNEIILMIDAVLIYCGYSAFDNTDNIRYMIGAFAIAGAITLIGWIGSNFRIVRR